MAELLTTNDKRTCLCAELSAANIGQTVCVMGWAQKQRDLGALIFIDLRDRSGIVCGRATILAEGDAAKRDDLVYLEKLPLFTRDGKALD